MGIAKPPVVDMSGDKLSYGRTYQADGAIGELYAISPMQGRHEIAGFVTKAAESVAGALLGMICPIGLA
jgi:hypothetical protein